MMIEFLLGRYRNPEAIFQHFDRPELECGKGDNEITKLEFRSVYSQTFSLPTIDLLLIVVESGSESRNFL